MLETLYQEALKRKKEPKEGSYTSYLYDKGLDKILKKVGEEATEVVIAAKNADKDEMANETADLLYHLAVALVETGVSLEEVEACLLYTSGCIRRPSFPIQARSFTIKKSCAVLPTSSVKLVLRLSVIQLARRCLRLSRQPSSRWIWRRLSLISSSFPMRQSCRQF